jgi:hypothetical protein
MAFELEQTAPGVEVKKAQGPPHPAGEDPTLVRQDAPGYALVPQATNPATLSAA